MNVTIELACELIQRSSVTPEDAGCQHLLAERLRASGCTATSLRFEEVDNLWVTHGNGEPVLAFLGHTDVVPAGPPDEWHSDPFRPDMRDGYLYGRGAADMKGSVAAMVTAMERFLEQYPDHAGTLALILTSDEEGPSINGTRRVAEYLQEHGIRIQWCVVGEPSSSDTLGDVIKNGRRGSLTGRLLIHGVQGHVAYPDFAENPVHAAAPALKELCEAVWDNGNDHYPPTGLQISSIHAGTGADNIIPGSLEIRFNFRYSTEVTEELLMERVNEILSRNRLRFDLDWLPSSKPFLTTEGRLIEVTCAAVAEETGREPQLSTAGGTSDGRFIAPSGAEVIELGPLNATIHKVNECVSVADLEALSRIYESIMKRLLVD
ncbi:MAG: succinyl-diaminopimelate desuccinylase [Gammaproteobacteria bacterium]